MIELIQFLGALGEIAPLLDAEPWDNVGLLVGDPRQTVERAILTIDYTAEVAAEAKQGGCDLVIAYHPPIFQPIKRITAPNLIFDAMRRGLAIYSPHTALDVAPGGTNDMLGDVLGLIDRRPLRVTPSNSSQYKLVTFIPQEDVERVGAALFSAGAGVIGNYTHCSFRSEGTGTFFGTERANPAVGETGKLEQVPEIRLELVVPIARIGGVIAALRASHPYEEPAFDLQQLAASPTGLGQGRIGSIEPIERQELFSHIKRELGLTHLLIAGPQHGPVSLAACCAGACGDHLDDALVAKCDFYLTGEIRHHDAIKAAEAGMTVVCTLHSNSERAVLNRLARKLNDKIPDLPLRISSTDRDPFMVL